MDNPGESTQDFGHTFTVLQINIKNQSTAGMLTKFHAYRTSSNYSHPERQ